MKFLVFILCLSLSQVLFAQSKYEILFRFDTAKAYEDIKKIKHTAYENGKKTKEKSNVIKLAKNGFVHTSESNLSPYLSHFLLEKAELDRDLIELKRDTLGRLIKKVYMKKFTISEAQFLYEMTDNYSFSGTDLKPTAFKRTSSDSGDGFSLTEEQFLLAMRTEKSS